VLASIKTCFNVVLFPLTLFIKELNLHIQLNLSFALSNSFSVIIRSPSLTARLSNFKVPLTAVDVTYNPWRYVSSNYLNLI